MYWKLEEARLVQQRAAVSAANADSLGIGSPGVPEGKCWIVLGFNYSPSVAETQTISFSKYSSKTTTFFGLYNPVSLALGAAGGAGAATFIEQGMEYILFPGEFLYVIRGGHTAGSTMSGTMQFIEIDLPLYTYDEPQIVKRQQMALSSIRSQLGGGVGRGGVGPGPSPGTRGGGGSGPAMP